MCILLLFSYLRIPTVPRSTSHPQPWNRQLRDVSAAITKTGPDFGAGVAVLGLSLGRTRDATRLVPGPVTSATGGRGPRPGRGVAPR